MMSTTCRATLDASCVTKPAGVTKLVAAGESTCAKILSARSSEPATAGRLETQTSALICARARASTTTTRRRAPEKPAPRRVPTRPENFRRADAAPEEVYPEKDGAEPREALRGLPNRNGLRLHVVFERVEDALRVVRRDRPETCGGAFVTASRRRRGGGES